MSARIKERQQQILLAEDEPHLLTLATTALMHKDYAIHSCNNGKKALSFLQKHPVDLLITDVQMPKMNGRELLCAAKSEFPDLKVIVMTGDDINPLEYKLLGALDVLQKPFDIAQLQHSVFTSLYQEKRYASRMDVRIPVSVDREIGCQSINLALGGILLEVAQPLRQGESVELALSVPHRKRTINLNGRVLHSRPCQSHYQTAVRFLSNIVDQLAENSGPLLEPATR